MEELIVKWGSVREKSSDKTGTCEKDRYFIVDEREIVVHD
jgi:hypothetical protein